MKQLVPPPEPPITAPPPEVPWWQTDLAQFLGYGALALGATALIVPALANIFTGPADEVAAAPAGATSAYARAMQALSRLRGIAPKVKPPTAPPPVAPAASSAARSFTRPPTATPPAQPPAAV